MERYPWRYRCPKCGSVDIIRRSPRGNPVLGKGHQGRRISSSGYTRKILQYVRRWQCRQCREVFDKPRDMLQGKEEK